jgi:hypothetical protein
LSLFPVDHDSMLFWRGWFGLAALGNYTRADLVAGEGRAQFVIRSIACSAKVPSNVL